MAKKINLHTFHDSKYDNYEELIDYVCTLGLQTESINFLNQYKRLWKFASGKYISEKADSIKLPTPIYVKWNENALKNLYKNTPSDLSFYIKTLRRKHASRCCCFCGSLVTNSLDHYLPQEVYPQFVILKENLLPICSDCNSKKNALVGSKYQRIIHPVFDDFIDDIRIKVKFIFDVRSVDFRLVVLKTLDNKNHDLVKFHYRYLLKNTEVYYSHFKALFESYEDRCTDGEFESLFTLLEEFKTQENISYKQSKTYNNWDTIFYRSIQADIEALQHLLHCMYP